MKKAKSTIQEKATMKKYIVEAPELKAGQNISTGGVRNNGKIAVLFSNPTLYEEPQIHQDVQEPSCQDSCKYQVTDFVIGLGIDALSMVWEEIGRPVVKSKLHQLHNKIESNEASIRPTAQDIHLPDFPNENDTVIPFTRKNIS